MLLKKRELSNEQLARLRKTQIIADVILIIVILSIGVYIILNIEPIKKLQSGEWNPCYVCEATVRGAACMLKGEPVLWSDKQAPENFKINVSSFSGYD